MIADLRLYFRMGKKLVLRISLDPVRVMQVSL